MEMAKLGSVEEQTTESILAELADDGRRRRRSATSRAGIDFAREVLERALGRRARRGAAGPALDGDRDAALRVPAPHPAGADRRVPARRVAADDRAGGREPAHGPRAQVLARLPERDAARHRAADRAHGRDRPQRDPAGRGGHAPEAHRGRRAGVLRRGRREVAGRHPQLRRPLDRAQRARPPRRHRRGPRRGGPADAVRLRGHRQARRPRDPAGAARGQPEGPRARAARRRRRRSRRRC